MKSLNISTIRKVSLAIAASIGIVAASMIAQPAVAATTTFYVSTAAGASDSNPGTQAQPWATLGRVNSATLASGDQVLFARGSAWQGLITAQTNGVTYSAYGSGANPRFSNPGPHNVIDVSADYVTIDGVRVEDADYGYSQLFGTGPQDSGGAIIFRPGSDHGIVRNSEFTNVGEGIKLFGSDHLVTHNSIHDLRISFQGNDPMFGATSYGAIGVAVKGPRMEVSYNSFVNCRAASTAYGHDGGAIEVEAIGLPAGTDSNTYIHHNRSTGSAGFIEVDNSNTFTNSTVSYNVVDDYQDFMLLFYESDVLITNNTVVHRLYDSTDSTNAVFRFPSSNNDANIRVNNNVFAVRDGLKVFDDGSPVRSNNVMWNATGTQDPVGNSLGSGDVVANPLFTNFAGNDFHIASTSPAVNRGSAVAGLTTDFDGNPFVGSPDSGAYENQTPAANLINDGGFEAQTDSTLRAPWAISSAGVSAGVDYHVGKSRTGDNSGWVSTSAAGWSAIQTSGTVQANTSYLLVGYVRTSGNFGQRGYFGVTLPGGAKTETTFGPTGAYSAGYTRIQVPFTTTAAGTFGLFAGIDGGDPSGSWFQLDDVSVSPVSLSTVDDVASGWSYGTGTWGSTTSSCDGRYACSSHWSNQTGATATLTFSGTQAELRLIKGAAGGIVGVKVDGGAEILYDTYSASVQNDASVTTLTGLSAGSHTVVLRVTGTKNASSTDTYVNVDRAITG